jgi:hypothetical protein
MKKWIIGTIVGFLLLGTVNVMAANVIGAGFGCIPFLLTDNNLHCNLANFTWDNINKQIQLGGTNVTATAAEINNAADVSANSEVLTTTQALDVTDCGRAFFIATDALVITLPATIAGCKMSFTNTGADGANIITISPAAVDYIAGTITLAASVVDLGVVDDKDLINTKTTSVTGDSATIIGDGVAGWFVLSSTGIWASE